MTTAFKSFAVILQLAFWFVLFSVILFISIYSADVPAALNRIVLLFICHLIDFYICYSVITPLFIEKRKFELAGAALLLLFCLITPVRIWIEHEFASTRFFGLGTNPHHVTLGLAILVEAAVAAFAIVARLAATNYGRILKKDEEDRIKLQNQLSFLKAQMSPHFLLNTVNNIYTLSLSRSEQGPDYLFKLSSILRYLLHECNECVTLKQEETALNTYVELFKLQQKGKLNLKIEFDVQDENRRVEPMILIPLLENAFKHSGLGLHENAYVERLPKWLTN
ncbi:sensor histidine kinase [Mucilaginibacter glaciei]|uniref:Histidine kinase n=1 Tax=Mucilaginibacter glaciei TaxID=2772109 RepID=A0A926NR71_9SPHI|nr:histidine kinase [Mucilaginibacter glaciei]MBD1393172.1 histidine kinase [Mucilaginibacter glaciei]